MFALYHGALLNVMSYPVGCLMNVYYVHSMIDFAYSRKKFNKVYVTDYFSSFSIRPVGIGRRDWSCMFQPQVCLLVLTQSNNSLNFDHVMMSLHLIHFYCMGYIIHGSKRIQESK